jgi:hypothetical protein
LGSTLEIKFVLSRVMPYVEDDHSTSNETAASIFRAEQTNQFSLVMHMKYAVPATFS